MLVITRSQGQSVLIGDDIEIIISEIGTEKIKLSIDAPRNIKIVRKELLEVEKENESASKAVSNDMLSDLRKHINK
jgi:carbon storage regulator